MIGLQELIVPALIILAIIIFIKIYKNKSGDVAKKLGKDIYEIHSATKDIPRAFKEGYKEAEKEIKNGNTWTTIW